MPFQHQNNDFLPPLKMPLSPYIPTPKTCFSSASCFYSIKSRRRAPEIERKSVQISGTCGGGWSPPLRVGASIPPTIHTRTHSLSLTDDTNKHYSFSIFNCAISADDFCRTSVSCSGVIFFITSNTDIMCSVFSAFFFA